MNQLQNKGFSVIELAVAVSVAATVAVGYLVWAKPENQNNAEKIAQTREKIDVIEQAIADFFVSESRLPCPADPLMRPNNTRATGSPSTDFGREAIALDVSGITCPTNIGLPPVMALGLEEDFAYDAWGRQFTYHVSQTLCGNDSADINPNEANSCTTQDFRDAEGELTVKDSAGADLTATAAYTLISHGADGVGAYLQSGVQISGSANENNDADTVYQYTVGDTSDFDLLIFRTKSQLGSLTLDPLGAVVSVNACNENSTTLASLSNTSSDTLNDGSTGIHQFQLSNSSTVKNSGSDLILGMLWGTQVMCIEYFTNIANSSIGWDGPACPGGGTFNTDDDTCICASGTWDGNCSL